MITGAALGLRPRGLAHRRARRHERRDGRRAAGRARPRRGRDRALGAQVLPFRLDVSKAAEVEALGAATLAALRRAALRLQQRRRRRRRPDLGEHAARTGSGCRRQPDGRGARRARVHADDAGGGARPTRPTRATSSTPRRWPGLLNPPNMGVYNVTKHAVVSHQRDAVPGPALVTDQVTRLGAVPVLRAHRHPPRASATGPAEMQRATPTPTRSQLIAPGDERQGGRPRQGHRGAGGAVRVRRDARAALLHLQPPEGAGAACRRGWRTSCRRATRPTRSRTSREIGAELRAALRATD